MQSENEYAELKRRVQEKGLLDKQPGYYTFRILSTLGLLAAGIAFLLFVNNPPLQLLNAVFLAFMLQQVAELGHDVTHQQVTRTRWKYLSIGLFMGNLLLGMSREWWIGKHNRHHSNPNQLDSDPDIDIPVLAFTPEQAVSKRGLSRWITKYQAFLLLPMLPLQALTLYGNSIVFLWQNKAKHEFAEVSLFVLHFVLYLGLIFSRLEPGWAILFILINQGLFGFLLAASFAPNHKGMLVIEANSTMGYLRRQILTARNILPNPVIDYFYGGLNYQIEHHLFPDMPRNNFGGARLVVKEYCAERGIPYYETGFFQSWREILGYMHEMGAPIRNSHPALTPSSSGN